MYTTTQARPRLVHKTMRVLIADSHDLMRQGLKQVVVTAFENVTIVEVLTLKEAIAEVRRSNWDLVLVDFWFPDGGGLGLLLEMKTPGKYCPTLVVSERENAEYAQRSML